MGIYFNYDFENGKEVENWLQCYLCRQKKVLIVEYHIKNGPIYSLYENARKLYSGHEVKLGSSRYLVCNDCYDNHGSEESVISEILKIRKQVDAPATGDYDPLKFLEEEIEEEKRELLKLIDRIGEMYSRLERERIKRQVESN